MKDRTIHVRHKFEPSGYDVLVATSRLGDAGDWARGCLGRSAAKAVIVSNPTIFSLYGEKLRRSMKTAGFDISVSLMKDGERYKDFGSLQEALRHSSAERLSREDVVVALGGGVVGDLAGFASAVYLRGIRFLHVPTTLLAMVDSSVGGKTGINSEFGKNLIGAFHRPSGVLINVDMLKTLPRRELTAGFCEAVKQGAIAGKRLFNETADYLNRFPPGSATVDAEKLVQLIANQVSFKASIVRQDEKEGAARNDRKSRKILNFGHSFGHALEKVTNYRRFRHGEAVGHGILLAGMLSKNLDILPQDELELLNDVVHRTGRLPSIPDIGPESIFEALKYDKKSASGSLNWVLLEGIGKPVIISDRDIPKAALMQAVKSILKK